MEILLLADWIQKPCLHMTSFRMDKICRFRDNTRINNNNNNNPLPLKRDPREMAITLERQWINRHRLCTLCNPRLFSMEYPSVGGGMASNNNNTLSGQHDITHKTKRAIVSLNSVYYYRYCCISIVIECFVL